MNQPQEPTITSLTPFVLSFTGSLALGIVSGWAMAKLDLTDDWSWAGLAVLPLWIALEIYFEATVEFFGAHSKAARILSIIGVLAGFYVTWFMVRGGAP